MWRQIRNGQGFGEACPFDETHRLPQCTAGEMEMNQIAFSVFVSACFVCPCACACILFRYRFLIHKVRSLVQRDAIRFVYNSLIRSDI